MAPGQGPEGGGRTEGNLGVVEPLRVPDGVARVWHRATAWFTAQPMLARLFIGLAAFDVLARGLGTIGPPLVLDPSTPLGLVASFLPHDLLILLPALVVLRRPTAAEDTPNILDGAVFVALAELLSHPSTALAATLGGTGLWAVVALAAVALQAIGWVAIARGLMAINPDPQPTTAGWSNLAAFGIAAAALVSVVTFLVGPGIDVGDTQVNQLLTLNALASLVAPLALAYLGRAVIRGLDDDRRPEIAVRLGSAAVFLAAGLGVITAVIILLATRNVGLAQAFTQNAAWSVLYWLATGGAVSLLVIAFGIGLADPTKQQDPQAVTLQAR